MTLSYKFSEKCLSLSPKPDASFNLKKNYLPEVRKYFYKYFFLFRSFIHHLTEDESPSLMIIKLQLNLSQIRDHQKDRIQKSTVCFKEIIDLL